MSFPSRPLRTHQAQIAAIVRAIASHRLEHEAAQTELLDPPSVLEHRLRQRIGEMVAQQAVEEGAVQAPKGQGLYHRYNAILKRCTGDKPRAQMSVQDLEAAVS